MDRRIPDLGDVGVSEELQSSKYCGAMEEPYGSADSELFHLC
jgi:hypothetical protein